MVAETDAAVVVGRRSGEPLVLVGPPGELIGHVHLHNRTDSKVVVRGAGLRDPDGRLPLPPTRQALGPIVLRPDQGNDVPLSVAVDPTTPPGEYAAELDLGGLSQPVVLHVTELLAVSASPGSVVVVNEAGIRQHRPVVVTNEGNVAFTLADPGAVSLREDMMSDRALRIAVDLLSRAEERADLERLAAAVLAVVRQETAGELEVQLANGPIEVQPGETKAIALEIILKEQLPASGRYRGRIPILTGNVDVTVLTSGGPLPQAAARPARRRTSPTRRSSKSKGGTS
jgi:hypothetical protein